MEEYRGWIAAITFVLGLGGGILLTAANEEQRMNERETALVEREEACKDTKETVAYMYRFPHEDIQDERCLRVLREPPKKWHQFFSQPLKRKE